MGIGRKRYKFLGNNKYNVKANPAVNSTSGRERMPIAGNAEDQGGDDDIMRMDEDLPSISDEETMGMATSLDHSSTSVVASNVVDIQSKIFYNNRCLGFNTAGNSIPNQLIGQWCLNFKETDVLIQNLLPIGTFGNIKFMIKFALLINKYLIN